MPGLGLPTLAECCHRLWPWPIYEPNSSYPGSSTMMEPVKVGSDDRNALIIPRLTATTAANGGSSFGEGLNLTANGRYDPLGTNPNPFTSANPIRYPNTRPVTQIDGLNRLNNFQGGRYDDIIMTDVMSFDVKVWDPGAPIFEIGPGGPNSVPIGPGDWGYIDALKQFSLSGQNSALRVVSFGAYVDLNYMQPTGSDPYDPAILRPLPNQPPRPYPAQIGYEAALFKMESSQRLPRGTLPRPKFSGAGDSGCLLSGLPAARGAIQFDKAPLNYAGFRACIYDTWSTSYERDGIDNDKDGQIDEGTDGMDNHPYLHGIDDPSEIDAPPPYPWSLRGVQIKIRAFEPNTKQIREVTVVTEFLPE